MSNLAWWKTRAEAAQHAVNEVLAENGEGRARVAFLSEGASRLNGAPVDVQEYFREAIICLQNDLTRSAIVVSWSGFFSLFCEALYAAKESDLRSNYDKWDLSDPMSFRENNIDAQIIQAAKKTGFIRRPKMRMLDGWLSQRNQCAHPTFYRPSLNIAIGYVETMVDEAMAIL